MDDPGHTGVTAVADTPVLGSFSAVDTDPSSASLIAALDEQASIPAIQRLRTAATELLGAPGIDDVRRRRRPPGTHRMLTIERSNQ